jgi:hypothetical protein
MGGGQRGRWRLAISLRAFLLLVLVAGGWMGWKADRARRQRLAFAAIYESHGWIGYDWQEVDEDATPPEGPPAPAWLRRMLGDEPFQEVVAVSFDECEKHAPVAGDDALGHLRAFPRLRSLTLNDLQHLGPALDGLPSPARLEELEFWADELDGVALARLRPLRGLSSLLIKGRDGAKLTEAGAEALAVLANLEELRLISIGVSDRSLAPLGRLSRLKLLEIQKGEGEGITDDGLARLAGLARLETLSISSSQVTDRGLKHVMGMTRLEVLHLEDSQVTPGGLKALRAARPGLRRHIFE